jgi:hypothetical protein
MPTLAELHRAVQAALAAKRVGRPVFVRYLLQGLDNNETARARLVEAAVVVRSWVDQPLERLYALSGGGQVSLTLQFRDGATALVSYARAQPRGDGVDVMVLGNHGAVYHDAGSARLWDEPPAAPAGPADPAILAAVEKSLRSGKAEPVGKEGVP